MGVFIQTERLALRSWMESDRDAFARLNADRRVMAFLPHVLSREKSDGSFDRIQAHFRRHGFGLFAAALRDDDAFIGFIGLFMPSFEAHFTPCVEIGWRLAVEYWNRGLATEGARAVVRYAFDVLRLDELVSFTVPANARSRRVMEKIGMTLDPEGGFDHPSLPPGHPFRPHVLYRLKPDGVPYGRRLFATTFRILPN